MKARILTLSFFYVQKSKLVMEVSSSAVTVVKTQCKNEQKQTIHAL
jgi:hypothetical protein